MKRLSSLIIVFALIFTLGIPVYATEISPNVVVDPDCDCVTFANSEIISSTTSPIFVCTVHEDETHYCYHQVNTVVSIVWNECIYCHEKYGMKTQTNVTECHVKGLK